MNITNTFVLQTIQNTVPDLAEQDIHETANLSEIGIDSLDLMTVLLDIQEYSGVEIPDTKVESLTTIKAIVDFINSSE